MINFGVDPHNPYGVILYSTDSGQRMGASWDELLDFANAIKRGEFDELLTLQTEVPEFEPDYLAERVIRADLGAVGRTP